MTLTDCWRAVSRGHAPVVELKAGALISPPHLGERFSKEAFEIVHPIVIGPELLLQGRPGDKGGLARIDAVQPLRQPSIYIDAIAVWARAARSASLSGTACFCRLSKYSF